MHWASHLDVDRSPLGAIPCGWWLWLTLTSLSVQFCISVCIQVLQKTPTFTLYSNHATTKWSYSLTKWREGIPDPTKATARRITHIKHLLLQNEDMLTVHHSTWANSRDEIRVANRSASTLAQQLSAQLRSQLNSTRL